MRCLAITVNGFRQTSSNKPMYSMDDMKGQKLRTPNIPHFIQMMDCLGVTSVPMAMSEIFNALETKVADGQENPYLRFIHPLSMRFKSTCWRAITCSAPTSGSSTRIFIRA